MFPSPSSVSRLYPPSPSRAGTGTVWDEDVPTHSVRSALRHLAVASTQLARESSTPHDDQIRFASAEARLRAMLGPEGELRGVPSLACPAVALDSGTTVSLADLLIDSCRRYRQPISPSVLDAEIIELAKELLSGLDWTLPN